MYNDTVSQSSASKLQVSKLMRHYSEIIWSPTVLSLVTPTCCIKLKMADVAMSQDLNTLLTLPLTSNLSRTKRVRVNWASQINIRLYYCPKMLLTYLEVIKLHGRPHRRYGRTYEDSLQTCTQGGLRYRVRVTDVIEKYCCAAKCFERLNSVQHTCTHLCRLPYMEWTAASISKQHWDSVAELRQVGSS